MYSRTSAALVPVVSCYSQKLLVEDYLAAEQSAAAATAVWAAV
jgi:hypothetical protein